VVGAPLLAAPLRVSHDGPCLCGVRVRRCNGGQQLFAVGAVDPAHLDLVTKRGKVVITAVAHPDATEMSGSLFMLTMMEKQIRGSLYGSSNAQHDIPRLLDLYNKGQLKLDELITQEYALEDVNQGYADMRNGLNIRGLIRY